MTPAVRIVHELVAALDGPDVAPTLAWLASTDDVFRRAKPATPAKHLVAYTVLRDPADGAVLLVDHVRSGLWLPPGGHVEPGEDPRAAATREAQEELGIDLVFSPAFLTETATNDQVPHTDVSLWCVADAHRGMPLTVDPREAREARWWTPVEVAAAGPHLFDPHLNRFLGVMGHPRAASG